MNNYEYLKNMSIEEMAEVIGIYVWSMMCDCDEAQQAGCAYRNDIPTGDCSECIKNNTKDWLEMNTLGGN